MFNVTWGAIFDWDGVIIDSASCHEESWVRLSRQEKLVLPEDHFRRGFGMKNERIIPEILQWTMEIAEIDRLSLRKEALYREVLRERKIEPLPGVREWLEQLRNAYIPCAIGSSTHRENIELALSITELSPYFSEIVCGEDVTLGKPDPEVFLKAAERILTPPERCIVFEDAHVGIQAARAGGMKVVGVATTHPASELGAADRVVRRLDELSVIQLSRWFLDTPQPLMQRVEQ